MTFLTIPAATYPNDRPIRDQQGGAVEDASPVNSQDLSRFTVATVFAFPANLAELSLPNATASSFKSPLVASINAFGHRSR